MTTRISTVLLGFTVAVSVALDNLLMGIVLLGALFNARAVFQIAKQNPVARAAWLLFGVLLAAVFYGFVPLSVAAGALGKYIDLLFVPVFMLMLRSDVARRQAQYAFLGAMALTLLLSYLVGLQLLLPQHWMSFLAQPDRPVIFHSYITQNNMMALAAFLALLQCRDASALKHRFAWGIFAILATLNILFMVEGRTGYMVFLVLLGCFVWTTLARYMHQRGKAWGWKQGMSVVMVLIGVVAATFTASSRLHDRVALVFAEYQAWQPNHEDQNSSAGLRLNYYYNTIQIIEKHPLTGVGTGGFERAFTDQIRGTNLTTVANPHNEYLLVTAQAGVVGLALLLYLFYTVWRCSPSLGTPFEQDAARGLVLAYMVNSAFNSALHDHADGLLFSFMLAVLFAGLKLGRGE